MFCVQESEGPHKDPFANTDKDPLNSQSDSDTDEPEPKRIKTSFTSPSLNLKVYQIPAYAPKSLSIFPSSPTQLPKFVNNPLNLANPLALNRNTENVVKSLQSRYSLPAKLSITPVPSKPIETGEVVRYKKNGEIAKKRGPPKGYKRKPKNNLSQSYNFGNGTLLQAQNALLTNLLVAANTTLSMLPSPDRSVFEPKLAPKPVVIPRVKIPEGVEVVELDLDPEDWFPSDPYKMTFSKKKNPKWKNFPYQCEHCFKGYRVASTLLTHAAERHGAVPKQVAIPCPCCPHVSVRRKQHKKHLETHQGKRHRIFCPYCLPLLDPAEPYQKESERFPFDKYPQYWYASEESLRLHKKRKHPYAALFNYNWHGTWGESLANS